MRKKKILKAVQRVIDLYYNRGKDFESGIWYATQYGDTETAKSLSDAKEKYKEIANVFMVFKDYLEEK